MMSPSKMGADQADLMAVVGKGTLKALPIKPA